MPKINQPASKIRMSFDEWFPVAQKYYQKHKNLLVPLDYETKDGKKLGKWIASKRKDYANNLLSLEKIKALDSIGMVWSINEKKWNDMFNLLIEYKNIHGNLDISSSYVTLSCATLGSWLREQQNSYLKGTLKEERQEKLESIGIIWQTNETKWYEMYKYAKEYQKEHGTLITTKNYITPNGKSLTEWLQAQRSGYHKKTLKPERIKLLEAIGMVWSINQSYTWHDMYLLAQEYQKEHGNLIIPRNYKGKNGLNLGYWLYKEKLKYRQGKLAPEKIIALEHIGIVWTNKINHDISKYLRKLKESDNPIIIDEKINADILNNISLIELESKIKYIIDMGALPIDNNGRLIDIFTISNTDMEERYGISLEAMIESFEVSSARKLYY